MSIGGSTSASLRRAGGGFAAFGEERRSFFEAGNRDLATDLYKRLFYRHMQILADRFHLQPQRLQASNFADTAVLAVLF